MGRKFELDRAELDVVLRKIKDARDAAEKQREIREKNLKAYYRLPLGNEKDGRSKVIDSAVFNHVAGLHPHLMRRFVASDLKIKVNGPDEKIAKALKQLVRDVINEQGGFVLIDAVLKDGEISHNGTTKMWWSRVWAEPEQREVEVNEQELTSLAADVRFQFDQQQIVPIPPRTAMVEDGMGTQFEVQGAPMYRLPVVFRDLIESGPVIAPMPPEEWITEVGKARINDRYGVGHVRMMTIGELERENKRRSLPGESFYDRLKEAADASVSGLSRERQERQDREDLAWTAPLALTGSDLRRTVEVIEWCDYVDDGSGELVPAFITVSGDVLLRAETNEDGIIPYSTWSPTPVPHSIIGQSIAWIHADEQNVRTVITRALLDHVAFAVDVPKFIRNRGVDMLGLQNLTPGKLIVGNPDDVVPFQLPPLDARLLQVLEYLKAEGEERGPATRLNQGADSGPGGNDTATGISIVTRASFNKIDLIAMCFSELWLVDTYNKIIKLYQQNMDLPAKVLVDGEQIELTRESIQGRYMAHSDLGIDVDFDDRQFQRASAMLAMATGLLKQGVYPFSPESVREHIKEVYLAAGKTDPSKYLQVVQQQSPPQMPGVPQGGPGGPPMPGMPPQLGAGDPQGDMTLEGGNADPAAGMAIGA